MSAILPLNINNLDDINAYNNLTAYEQELFNNCNFSVSDNENYDLLMAMYENQYSYEIMQNTEADTDLSTISNNLSVLV